MDSMPGLLTSRQRWGVTRPVMTWRFSERMTDAPSVSAGVMGPREAVRARVDRPEAWTAPGWEPEAPKARAWDPGSQEA